MTGCTWVWYRKRRRASAHAFAVVVDHETQYALRRKATRRKANSPPAQSQWTLQRKAADVASRHPLSLSPPRVVSLEPHDALSDIHDAEPHHALSDVDNKEPHDALNGIDDAEPHDVLNDIDDVWPPLHKPDPWNEADDLPPVPGPHRRRAAKRARKIASEGHVPRASAVRKHVAPAQPICVPAFNASGLPSARGAYAAVVEQKVEKYGHKKRRSVAELLGLGFQLDHKVLSRVPAYAPTCFSVLLAP
ncbi:hypothetical protein GGX14DRAFT_556116 [Mycena pura]|uniref:Uncharacterized protein n=1 Tax=Mycena pura TaxID=153505 RepID=A0AAD6YNX9_9AGAR|nr:hypothetical protein GGX14DRAFT_556116 [Mycena pura]